MLPSLDGKSLKPYENGFSSKVVQTFFYWLVIVIAILYYPNKSILYAFYLIPLLPTPESITFYVSPSKHSFQTNLNNLPSNVRSKHRTWFKIGEK